MNTFFDILFYDVFFKAHISHNTYWFCILGKFTFLKPDVTNIIKPQTLTSWSKTVFLPLNRSLCLHELSTHQTDYFCLSGAFLCDMIQIFQDLF